MRSITNLCAAALLLGCLSLVSGCKDSSIPNMKEPERIRDMAKVVLSGTMANDRNPATGMINEPVLVMDTGEKFVLFNAPYVNTLREQIGKRVKVRGSMTGPTSFRNYRGIIIDDILEVK